MREFIRIQNCFVRIYFLFSDSNFRFRQVHGLEDRNGKFLAKEFFAELNKISKLYTNYIYKSPLISLSNFYLIDYFLTMGRRVIFNH